jgi:hypothetical protein
MLLRFPMPQKWQGEFIRLWHKVFKGYLLRNHPSQGKAHDMNRLQTERSAAGREYMRRLESVSCADPQKVGGDSSSARSERESTSGAGIPCFMHARSAN